jgi:hypothetical protein
MNESGRWPIAPGRLARGLALCWALGLGGVLGGVSPVFAEGPATAADPGQPPAAVADSGKCLRKCPHATGGGQGACRCPCKGRGHDHGHDHDHDHGHHPGHGQAHRPEPAPGAATIRPATAGAEVPHPASVPPSPPGERLLLDSYADGSWAGRLLALHQALGARLEAHDETGQTLLMKAAARGDLPLVQALLAAGVAVLPTDIHGWSALEHAVQGRAPETALALIAAGARERIDHHENSTLQYAVNLEADPRVIAALVQAGADVNRRSRDGLTVLMEAIDAGNPPASIEALLAAPALDPGLCDPAGEDALAHARARGDAVITEAIRMRLGTSSLH